MSTRPMIRLEPPPEPEPRQAPGVLETEAVEFMDPATSEDRIRLRAVAISLRSTVSGRRARRPSRRPQIGRLVRLLSPVLAAVLVVTAVRLSAIVVSPGDSLQVRVGDQAPVPVDLRQDSPVSPYLFGANVFPAASTSSLDGRNTGFMNYGPAVTRGLASAGVRLLRFPGGTWGEQHVLSPDQLNAYSTLLNATGAEGMIQARLSGPEPIHDRAARAGQWVEYMNNPKSGLRAGGPVPFHAVRLWTVGNEPDLLVNAATGRPYTVAEYVTEFTQFSIAMHLSDPRIMVFGPDLSQFYGVGAGPADAEGRDWMTAFLQGVGAYERAHPELGFQLLDGVSFHFYPDPSSSAAGLMMNSDVWNYLLPPLRQLVRENLGRDAPIAVTEINSNAVRHPSSPGVAALWWADTLGTLMNQEVAYAGFFPTAGVEAPEPLFTGSDLHGTPMLRVLQVYSHLQGRLVPVTGSGRATSVYATQDASHRVLGLLFVNKTAFTQLAQVRADAGFLRARDWPDLDLSLRALSVTELTLRRDGTADAYSFAVSAGPSAQAAPLTHTVCGHKSDLLAREVPC